MNTETLYPEVSAVDALWTLYRQQSESVRRSFLARVRKEENDMPGMYSREEMMEVAKQRMRDIVVGREETLSHKDVMQLVDQSIAETV